MLLKIVLQIKASSPPQAERLWSPAVDDVMFVATEDIFSAHSDGLHFSAAAKF